jgi:drug/metabolite transporter (DMT)-like permease
MAIKIGLQDSPPFWSAGIRFIIASLIIVIINLVRRKKYPREIAEIIRIGVPGIFLYGFSYLLVYWAETYIDSSLTAIIFSSLPIFVAIISIFMLRDERLAIWGWFGMALGLAGIVLISFQSFQESAFHFWGAVMAVLGAISSAYGTVCVRAHLKNQDIFIMAAIQMIIGAVIMVSAALIFEPISSFRITFKSIGALSYLAVFGTVVAFLGYYHLLQKMKAISVSLISFIIPVIAVLLGYIFLSESLTVAFAFGAAMILIGVALVLRG